ncbi:sensor histidine kinase [Stenotrophomonas sp. NRRL B-14846]|uniref:sensor histidine kinase n=1 Tax=Stenotrophomonas sp. NRRL B-14846 TaxID=3162882 RepID=UPI003D2D3B27
MAKLRDISTLLRPPQLDALGLEAALSWQARVLFRSSPVELLAEIEPLPHRPDNSIETGLLPHRPGKPDQRAAPCARQPGCLLQLRDVGQRGLHLQIRDDGEGFDPDGPRGLGLIVMRERAQSVGATCGSSPRMVKAP